MNKFRKVLGAISYACLAGTPILAATGVGTAVSIALGAVGVAAGAVLHFMDNPRDAKAAAEVGTTVKGAIQAVKAIRKGQSGT